MSLEKIKKLVALMGVNRSPGSSVKKGWLYSPLPFPGFDFPCHRKETTEARWDAIDKEVMFWDNLKVLDYGCTTGYFAFQAMKNGAIAVGVDKDDASIRVAQRVLDGFKDQYRLRGKFYQAEELVSCDDWDVMFLTSVLNWMGREKAEEMLKWVRTHVKIVFIEVPCANDGMGGAGWLKDEKDVKNWIIEHTGFKVNELITTLGPGGKERVTYCARRYE